MHEGFGVSGILNQLFVWVFREKWVLISAKNPSNYIPSFQESTTAVELFSRSLSLSLFFCRVQLTNYQEFSSHGSTVDSFDVLLQCIRSLGISISLLWNVFKLQYKIHTHWLNSHKTKHVFNLSASWLKHKYRKYTSGHKIN